MKKKSLVGLIVPALFGLQSNATVVKGTVEGGVDNIVYTVSVIPEDTLRFKTVVFNGFDRVFDVPVGDIKGDVKVRVTASGYNEYRKVFNRVDTSTVLDLGVVSMEKSLILNEVVVKAPKLSVEHDGADYTIRNLSGTVMGNAGNGIDMLRWTPGVMVKNNDEISVIGRGATEIYINDRKIMNKSELRALSSNNVSKIEIIKEPDAKYSSQVASVIKIYTKKPIKDYLATNITDAVAIKQRLSNVTSLNVDGKNGRLSGNVSLSYTLGNTEVKSSNYKSITTDKGIYEKTDSFESSAKAHVWNLFAGLNYELNKKSVLGVQYDGAFTRMDMKMSDMFHVSDLERKYSICSPATMDYDNDKHSVSASYQWERNKTSKLLIIADYATTIHNDRKNIDEKNLQTGNSAFNDINNVNDYDIYTLSADYNFSIGKLSNSIGANAGYVNSIGNAIMNGNIQGSDRDNSYASLYYTFSRRWNRFTLKGGIRYEYDNTKTKIYDNGEKTDNFSKSYSNLLPNISMGYKFNKNVNFTMYYRRTMTRPTYSQLRPTVYYERENEYSTGNPLLRPSFTDRINLTANLYGVTLQLAYRNITDKIASAYINEENNIIDKPVNINHSHIWSMDADWFYRKDWFNMGLHVDASIPNVSYPYLETTVKVNDLMWGAFANFEFTVAQKYMLGAKFIYNSKANMGYYVSAPAAGIDLSAMTILCKGKLLVGVTANDLLRRSMVKWSENRYHNTYVYSQNVNDTRGVSVMVRYTFNMINNPFKKRCSNDRILNRTNEEH